MERRHSNCSSSSQENFVVLAQWQKEDDDEVPEDVSFNDWQRKSPSYPQAQNSQGDDSDDQSGPDEYNVFLSESGSGITRIVRVEEARDVSHRSDDEHDVASSLLQLSQSASRFSRILPPDDDISPPSTSTTETTADSLPAVKTTEQPSKLDDSAKKKKITIISDTRYQYKNDGSRVRVDQTSSADDNGVTSTEVVFRRRTLQPLFTPESKSTYRSPVAVVHDQGSTSTTSSTSPGLSKSFPDDSNDDGTYIYRHKLYGKVTMSQPKMASAAFASENAEDDTGYEENTGDTPLDLTKSTACKIPYKSRWEDAKVPDVKKSDSEPTSSQQSTDEVADSSTAAAEKSADLRESKEAIPRLTEPDECDSTEVQAAAERKCDDDAKHAKSESSEVELVDIKPTEAKEHEEIQQQEEQCGGQTEPEPSSPVRPQTPESREPAGRETTLAPADSLETTDSKMTESKIIHNIDALLSSSTKTSAPADSMEVVSSAENLEEMQSPTVKTIERTTADCTQIQQLNVVDSTEEKVPSTESTETEQPNTEDKTAGGIDERLKSTVDKPLSTVDSDVKTTIDGSDKIERPGPSDSVVMEEASLAEKAAVRTYLQVSSISDSREVELNTTESTEVPPTEHEPASTVGKFTEADTTEPLTASPVNASQEETRKEEDILKQHTSEDEAQPCDATADHPVSPLPKETSQCDKLLAEEDTVTVPEEQQILCKFGKTNAEEDEVSQAETQMHKADNNSNADDKQEKEATVSEEHFSQLTTSVNSVDELSGKETRPERDMESNIPVPEEVQSVEQNAFFGEVPKTTDVVKVPEKNAQQEAQDADIPSKNIVMTDEADDREEEKMQDKISVETDVSESADEKTIKNDGLSMAQALEGTAVNETPVVEETRDKQDQLIGSTDSVSGDIAKRQAQIDTCPDKPVAASQVAKHPTGDIQWQSDEQGQNDIPLPLYSEVPKFKANADKPYPSQPEQSASSRKVQIATYEERSLADFNTSQADTMSQEMAYKTVSSEMVTLPAEQVATSVYGTDIPEAATEKQAADVSSDFHTDILKSAMEGANILPDDALQPDMPVPTLHYPAAQMGYMPESVNQGYYQAYPQQPVRHMAIYPQQHQHGTVIARQPVPQPAHHISQTYISVNRYAEPQTRVHYQEISQYHHYQEPVSQFQAMPPSQGHPMQRHRHVQAAHQPYPVTMSQPVTSRFPQLSSALSSGRRSIHEHQHEVAVSVPATSPYVHPQFPVPPTNTGVHGHPALVSQAQSMPPLILATTAMDVSHSNVSSVSHQLYPGTSVHGAHQTYSHIPSPNIQRQFGATDSSPMFTTSVQRGMPVVSQLQEQHGLLSPPVMRQENLQEQSHRNMSTSSLPTAVESIATSSVSPTQSVQEDVNIFKGISEPHDVLMHQPSCHPTNHNLPAHSVAPQPSDLPFKMSKDEQASASSSTGSTEQTKSLTSPMHHMPTLSDFELATDQTKTATFTTQCTPIPPDQKEEPAQNNQQKCSTDQSSVDQPMEKKEDCDLQTSQKSEDKVATGLSEYYEVQTPCLDENIYPGEESTSTKVQRKNTEPEIDADMVSTKTDDTQHDEKSQASKKKDIDNRDDLAFDDMCNKDIVDVVIETEAGDDSLYVQSYDSKYDTPGTPPAPDVDDGESILSPRQPATDTAADSEKEGKEPSTDVSTSSKEYQHTSTIEDDEASDKQFDNKPKKPAETAKDSDDSKATSQEIPKRKVTSTDSDHNKKDASSKKAGYNPDAYSDTEDLSFDSEFKTSFIEKTQPVQSGESSSSGKTVEPGSKSKTSAYTAVPDTYTDTLQLDDLPETEEIVQTIVNIAKSNKKAAEAIQYPEESELRTDVKKQTEAVRKSPRAMLVKDNLQKPEKINAQKHPQESVVPDSDNQETVVPKKELISGKAENEEDDVDANQVPRKEQRIEGPMEVPREEAKDVPINEDQEMMEKEAERHEGMIDISADTKDTAKAISNDHEEYSSEEESYDRLSCSLDEENEEPEGETKSAFMECLNLRTGYDMKKIMVQKEQYPTEKENAPTDIDPNKPSQTPEKQKKKRKSFDMENVSDMPRERRNRTVKDYKLLVTLGKNYLEAQTGRNPTLDEKPSSDKFKTTYKLSELTPLPSKYNPVVTLVDCNSLMSYYNEDSGTSSNSPHCANDSVPDDTVPLKRSKRSSKMSSWKEINRAKERLRRSRRGSEPEKPVSKAMEQKRDVYDLTDDESELSQDVATTGSRFSIAERLKSGRHGAPKYQPYNITQKEGNKFTFVRQQPVVEPEVQFPEKKVRRTRQSHGSTENSPGPDTVPQKSEPQESQDTNPKEEEELVPLSISPKHLNWPGRSKNSPQQKSALPDVSRQESTHQSEKPQTPTNESQELNQHKPSESLIAAPKRRGRPPKRWRGRGRGHGTSSIHDVGVPVNTTHVGSQLDNLESHRVENHEAAKKDELTLCEETPTDEKNGTSDGHEDSVPGNPGEVHVVHSDNCQEKIEDAEEQLSNLASGQHAEESVLRSAKDDSPKNDVQEADSLEYTEHANSDLTANYGQPKNNCQHNTGEVEESKQESGIPTDEAKSDLHQEHAEYPKDLNAVEVPEQSGSKEQAEIMENSCNTDHKNIAQNNPGKDPKDPVLDDRNIAEDNPGQSHIIENIPDGNARHLAQNNPDTDKRCTEHSNPNADKREVGCAEPAAEIGTTEEAHSATFCEPSEVADKSDNSDKPKEVCSKVDKAASIDVTQHEKPPDVCPKEVPHEMHDTLSDQENPNPVLGQHTNYTPSGMVDRGGSPQNPKRHNTTKSSGRKVSTSQVLATNPSRISQKQRYKTHCSCCDNEHHDKCIVTLKSKLRHRHSSKVQPKHYFNMKKTVDSAKHKLIQRDINGASHKKSMKLQFLKCRVKNQKAMSKHNSESKKEDSEVLVSDFMSTSFSAELLKNIEEENQMPITLDFDMLTSSLTSKVTGNEDLPVLSPPGDPQKCGPGDIPTLSPVCEERLLKRRGKPPSGGYLKPYRSEKAKAGLLPSAPSKQKCPHSKLEQIKPLDRKQILTYYQAKKIASSKKWTKARVTRVERRPHTILPCSVEMCKLQLKGKSITIKLPCPIIKAHQITRVKRLIKDLKLNVLLDVDVMKMKKRARALAKKEQQRKSRKTQRLPGNLMMKKAENPLPPPSNLVSKSLPIQLDATSRKQSIGSNNPEETPPHNADVDAVQGDSTDPAPVRNGSDDSIVSKSGSSGSLQRTRTSDDSSLNKTIPAMQDHATQATISEENTVKQKGSDQKTGTVIESKPASTIVTQLDEDIFKVPAATGSTTVVSVHKTVLKENLLQADSHSEDSKRSNLLGTKDSGVKFRTFGLPKTHWPVAKRASRVPPNYMPKHMYHYVYQKTKPLSSSMINYSRGPYMSPVSPRVHTDSYKSIQPTKYAPTLAEYDFEDDTGKSKASPLPKQKAADMDLQVSWDTPLIFDKGERDKAPRKSSTQSSTISIQNAKLSPEGRPIVWPPPEASSISPFDIMMEKKNKMLNVSVDMDDLNEARLLEEPLPSTSHFPDFIPQNPQEHSKTSHQKPILKRKEQMPQERNVFDKFFSIQTEKSLPSREKKVKIMLPEQTEPVTPKVFGGSFLKKAQLLMPSKLAVSATGKEIGEVGHAEKESPETSEISHQDIAPETSEGHSTTVQDMPQKEIPEKASGPAHSSAVNDFPESRTVVSGEPVPDSTVKPTAVVEAENVNRKLINEMKAQRRPTNSSEKDQSTTSQLADANDGMPVLEREPPQALYIPPVEPAPPVKRGRPRGRPPGSRARGRGRERLPPPINTDKYFELFSTEYEHQPRPVRDIWTEVKETVEVVRNRTKDADTAKDESPAASLENEEDSSETKSKKSKFRTYSRRDRMERRPDFWFQADTVADVIEDEESNEDGESLKLLSFSRYAGPVKSKERFSVESGDEDDLPRQHSHGNPDKAAKSRRPEHESQAIWEEIVKRPADVDPDKLSGIPSTSTLGTAKRCSDDDYLPTIVKKPRRQTSHPIQTSSTDSSTSTNLVSTDKELKAVDCATEETIQSQSLNQVVTEIKEKDEYSESRNDNVKESEESVESVATEAVSELENAVGHEQTVQEESVENVGAVMDNVEDVGSVMVDRLDVANVATDKLDGEPVRDQIEQQHGTNNPDDTAYDKSVSCEGESIQVVPEDSNKLQTDSLIPVEDLAGQQMLPASHESI